MCNVQNKLSTSIGEPALTLLGDACLRRCALSPNRRAYSDLVHCPNQCKMSKTSFFRTQTAGEHHRTWSRTFFWGVRAWRMAGLQDYSRPRECAGTAQVRTFSRDERFQETDRRYKKQTDVSRDKQKFQEINRRFKRQTDISRDRHFLGHAGRQEDSFC